MGGGRGGEPLPLQQRRSGQGEAPAQQQSRSDRTLHRKDLGIAIGLADELNVPVPTAMLVAHLEDELIKTGHAEEDISALARRLRDIANEIDPA